jgi:hypothetical protein
MNPDSSDWSRSLRFLATSAACIAAILSVSCTGAGKYATIETESTNPATGKVAAEAYLYDAVLVREGKTTSFRLEIYATDSVLGLAGRGYLGKGALRGLVRQKALQVYFPSTNEYVDDPYDSLLSGGDCALSLNKFDPVGMMFAIPDSSSADSLVSIQLVDDGPKVRTVAIVAESCLWRLELSYDQKANGWKPFALKYTDGHGTSLTAVRREYQPHANVSRSRFLFSHPIDATRLKP